MPGKAFRVEALQAPSPAWTCCLPSWLSLVPLWCVGSWAQGKATLLLPMLGCQFLWEHFFI